MNECAILHNHHHLLLVLALHHHLDILGDSQQLLPDMLGGLLSDIAGLNNGSNSYTQVPG
jgi:hypothetical protein